MWTFSFFLLNVEIQIFKKVRMSTYKSYLERFNKSRTTKRDTSLDAKLTSEKETYTQFLEVQLDRISHGLVQIDNFQDKLDLTTAQVSDLDDKVNNSSKLLKLLQSCAENQEDENSKNMERFQTLNEKQDIITSRLDRFVPIEKFNHVLARLEELERRSGVEPSKHKSYDDHSTSAGGERLTERHAREIEYKITESLNQKAEAHFRNLKLLEDKIIEYNEKHSRDMATDIKTLENRMSDFMKQLDGRHGAGLKEDLYKKIELVMNEMKNTVSYSEFDKLRNKLDKEKHERKDTDQQIDKFHIMNERKTADVIEDLIQKINNFDNKLQDLELLVLKQSTHLFSEKKVVEDIATLEISVKELWAKIDSNPPRKGAPSMGRSSSTDNASVFAEMREIEKKLTDQLANGIDRFSNLLKKYIEKQRAVEDTVEEIRRKLLDERSIGLSAQRSKQKLTSPSPQQNPFLKAKMVSPATDITPKTRVDSEDLQTSFGNRNIRTGMTSLTDFDDALRGKSKASTKSSKGFKKDSRRSGSRSRSQSKSPNTSNISRGSMRNQSLNRRASRGSSKGRSRSHSPGVRSPYLTPSKRVGVKGRDSASKRINDSIASSAKKSTLKDIQNKIDQERKLREEKIKKLIKKSKVDHDTPKFTENQSTIVKPKRSVTLTGKAKQTAKNGEKKTRGLNPSPATKGKN